MSSVGELTVDVKCDVSELTEGQIESRREIETTTRSIMVQDATWKGLADSVAEAAGRIAPEITRITEVAAGLTTTVLTYRFWGGAIATAAAPITALGAAFLRFGGIATSIAGYLVPQWRLITTAISLGRLAYVATTSDIAQESYRAVAGSSSVSASTDRLTEALGRLGEAAGRPFAAFASGTEDWLASINPLPVILGFIERKTAEWIDTATAGIEYITPLVNEFSDQAETAIFVMESLYQATDAETQAFYEQGKSLRALAAESERVIAIQEGQRGLYQNIAALQASATAAAEQSAEVRRIRSIENLDQLDLEIAKIQQKANVEITSGKATEESQKRIGAVFAAIANQREAILAGDVKPKEDPAEKALEAAREALFALEHGQDAAAVAALRAKGATDEQVAALERLQEATRRVTEEQKTAKETEQRLEDAAKRAMAEGKKAVEDAATTWQKGEDRIAALKDQLDLASGAATKASIAMRDALRDGFTEEQAKEIGDLTAKLEQEKQTTRDREVKGVAAAEFGSSDAFSTIFSAMRNTGGPQERLVKTADAQLEAQLRQEKLLEEIANGQVDVEFMAGAV